jgi:hypothetical protein
MQITQEPTAGQQPATTGNRPPGTPPVVRRAGSIQCDVLPPHEYAEWDALVDRSPHGTVFHYSWWLEISSPRFQILGVRDKGGRLVAGIPLPMRRLPGLSLIHSPSLTPYLGPIFDLSREHGICDQLYLMRSYGELLARRIPAFDSFRCVVGASGPDLQGFLWAGFQAELAYTFRISRSQTLASVEEQMTRTHYQNLSKALRLRLQVTRNEAAAASDALAEMHRRRHEALLYPEEIARRLCSAALERGKGDLYLARSSDEVPVAALFTVHDLRTTYQIISGFETSREYDQGSYILLWRALKDALEEGRDYDFEGSSLRGVEKFYRRWGATAAPVWRLVKVGSFRGFVMHHLIRRRDAKTREAGTAKTNQGGARGRFS